MGKWSWEGFDKNGKRTKGVLDASSEREARRTMRTMGIRPRKLTPPSILEFDIGEYLVAKGFTKPFGAKELCYFTKQLAIMVNAGVPILQSLDILWKQEPNLSLKRTLKSVTTSVGEGKTLADAMKNETGFDKLYCNLVKAGEVGGILDIILNKLAEHMEKQERTKAQIKSAMTYPVIVCFVGLAVIYGMITFVVPQFADMLKETGQELPWITKTVVDLSTFFGKWSIVIIPGMIVAIFLLLSFIKTPSGKRIYDNLTMRLPIFGPVIIRGNLNSFCRTLATMITSGISLVDSLEICIETIDHTVVARDVKKVRRLVVQGRTLTEPLSGISYFPPMVCQMVKVGEQTGNLDEMLAKVADVFEEEVNNLVSSMTKMIEPIILVVLGGCVAVILIAMYMPIFMSAGGGDSF